MFSKYISDLPSKIHLSPGPRTGARLPERSVPGTLLLQFLRGLTLAVVISPIAVTAVSIAFVPWSLSRQSAVNVGLFSFQTQGVFFVVITHGSCAGVVSGKDTVERQGMPSPESCLGQATASSCIPLYFNVGIVWLFLLL